MSMWWSRLRALVRRLAAGRQAERALNDEIQAYLQEDIDARVRSGERPADARRAALGELGGIEQVKERVRDARTGAWVDSLLQDVRYGVRTLVKTPGYSLAVVGSLSLGMAAVIAGVAFANGIMLRPFPGIRDQRELVEIRIEQCFRSGCIPIDTRPGDYLSLRDTVTALQGIAASTGSPVSVALPDARALSASLVTANFFDVLGTAAAIGRTFAPEEADLARAGVAVIAHRLWVREFAADPEVLGRVIRVADNDVVIIGVAPEEFAGIDLGVGRSGPDMWLPLSLVDRVGSPATTSDDPSTDDRYIRYIGRLAPGGSLDHVSAQAGAVAWDIAARKSGRQSFRAAVSPVQMHPFGKVAPVLTMVLAVPAIVLVIGCVNASNLLLARSSARQHEIAIRLAIGANRERIVRQLLTETLLLVGTAALTAVPLVWWGLRIAVTYLAVPMPLDATVLAVTVVIAASSAVACGLSPAFRVTRSGPVETFGPPKATGATRAQTRSRRALLVVQVALSLALLAGGVQLVTALKGLDRTTGAPTDRLLMASFDLGQLNFRPIEAEAFYAALLDRVSRLPGVQAAGFAPTRGVWTFRHGLAFDNSVVVWRPEDRPSEGIVALGGYAGGHLLEALGLRLLQGRTFTDDDRRTAMPQVAVVNRVFAEKLLERRAPGATLSVALRNQPFTASTELRVIGVIEAAQEPSYNRQPPYAVPTIYVPVPLEPIQAQSLYVREHESSAVAPLVRQAVRQVDPRVPILQLESLAQANDRLLLPENTLARATAGLGVIALLLATWGLYGVVSYVVTLRSRDIAVRLALGARPNTIVRMLLREAMTMAAAGAAIGGAVAIATARVIESEVHTPGGLSAATIAWPAAVLIAVMLAASAIPAARAGRVNLLQLLKEN